MKQNRQLLKKFRQDPIILNFNACIQAITSQPIPLTNDMREAIQGLKTSVERLRSGYVNKFYTN